MLFNNLLFINFTVHEAKYGIFYGCRIAILHFIVSFSVVFVNMVFLVNNCKGLYFLRKMQMIFFTALLIG